MLTLMFALFVFITMFFITTSKFMSDHTVIKLSTHEYSVGEVPFPAVSVCADLKLPSIYDITTPNDTTILTNEGLRKN